MNFSKEFVIEISSDLDYEDMVANILYKEETVALISQDKGIEYFEIELFPPIEESRWKFILEDFLNAILFAKKQLLIMKRPTEE